MAVNGCTVAKLAKKIPTPSPEAAIRESRGSHDVTRQGALDMHITNMCEGRKIVLMVDEVDKFMYEILILGEPKTYNIDNPDVSLADMFGYIKDTWNQKTPKRASCLHSTSVS